MKRYLHWSLALAALLAIAPSLEAAPNKHGDKPGKAPKHAAPAMKAPKAVAQKAPVRVQPSIAKHGPVQSRPHARPQAIARVQTERSAPNFRQFQRAQQQQQAVSNANVRARAGQHQPSVAFGGSTRAPMNQTAVNRTDARRFAVTNENRVYKSSSINVYRPPYTVYRDWDRGREHYWSNHRYHWRDNTWVIIDAPTVSYSSAGDDSALIGTVQARLLARGYRPGPVDGELGGQTRDAIAAFQSEHGLAVTGDINNSLLRTLGL